MRRDARRGRRRLALAALGPGGLAAAAIWGWSRRRGALRPIGRMAVEIEGLDVARLDRRVAVPPVAGATADLALALNALLDRVEHGVVERRWLIAEASHELRAPLTAMKARVDVSLRADELSSPAREVMQGLRDEVDRMARTLDDVLELARGADGGLELAPVPVELGQAIEAALCPLRPLAQAKGLTVEVDGDSCEAEADPHRLHQALTNIIENAIKFTPAGGEVRVSAWHREGLVGVTVADDGPGIPTEARGRVFERFYRVSDERVRDAEGSGLGLAICREIAAAHGGRVWVDSEEDRGNAFSLELPGAAARH